MSDIEWELDPTADAVDKKTSNFGAQGCNEKDLVRLAGLVATNCSLKSCFQVDFGL